MRGNLPGPEGLARRGASAALHGLPVVTTTGGAARLASAPSPCQRGSREILRQAPWAAAALMMSCASYGSAGAPSDATWHFAVSRDSPNCGAVAMPAIAARAPPDQAVCF